MNHSEAPLTAERLVAVLAALYRQQGNTELAGLLEAGLGRLDTLGYDRDNTAVLRLSIQVPVELYASVEHRLAELEDEVLLKARMAGRSPGVMLESLEITPTLIPTATVIETRANEGEHLWDPGMLRLFLSHVSVHRAAVGHLKRALRIYGISCFVAHDDISPSREWQQEILRAVASMHAMAALLTPEFHGSDWTDQEVGMAIARGVVMLPVNLGLGPYGFMSAHQALRSRLSDTDDMAYSITKALVTNPKTAGIAAEALSGALGNANSFAEARNIVGLLEESPAFTAGQLGRIESARVDNRQVAESFGVSERIKRLVERHRGS